MSDLAIRIHVWATSTLAALRSEERGQDLIEYALWGGIIAAALVAVGVAIIVPGVNDMANNLVGCIDFDGTSDCGPFV